MSKIARFMLCACFLLIAQFSSADGFDKRCFRLQLSAAGLPEFTGGHVRDSVTVGPDLGAGLTLNRELRRKTFAIDFEISILVLDLHTSTALYGGYYGTYEDQETVLFARFGVGVSSYFRQTERYSNFVGVRVYLQSTGDYAEYGYGFSNFSIAPYVGFDKLSKSDSRWFFTGSFQLNLLDIDEVGVKVMPQLNLGMGYRF